MLKRIVLLAGVFAVVTAHAGNEGHVVAPAHEYEKAQSLGLQGPTKNEKVGPVTLLGKIGLGDDFPQMEGRDLRARIIVVQPGGVVGVHQHEQRPGVAYILEGEITEHRSDEDGPLIRRVGDAAFEKGGISHWWQNHTDAPTTAIVVDIVPSE